MRTFALALLLLCMCTGAEATQVEPFGVRLQIVPDIWAITMRAELAQTDKELVASIAKQIREKNQPVETWPAWVNQLVNLAGIRKCAPTAIIELEVLRQLGFKVLRLVEGREDSAKDNETHAVAAVLMPDGGWWIIDNRHLGRADYRAQLDTQLSLMRPHFHPFVAYKF